MPIRIPKMYDEMPLPYNYYDQSLPPAHPTRGFNMNLMLQYAQQVGREPAELTAGEMMMFATEDGHMANNAYVSFLKTGEVPPLADEIRQKGWL